MGRIAIFLSVLLLLGAAVRADETKLVTFLSPASEGFVLSVDLPDSPNWKRDVTSISASGSYVGSHVVITWQGAHEGHAPPVISVSMRVWKKSFDFDEYIEGWNYEGLRLSMTIYEKGIDNTVGQETFYVLHSDVDCYSGGQTIKCTKPTKLIYTTVMHDRVSVDLTLLAIHAKDFEKHKPLLKRIAKTIEVIPEDELDPAETSQYYTSPSVLTSKRRGHYLENHIKILLPPGWTAEETDIRHATATNERGRLQVEFSPDNRSPGPSELYEVFYVIAEGLPYSILKKSDYLATGEHYVSSVLDEHTKVETPSSAAMLDHRSYMHGFCKSKAKTQYSDGTSGIHVSTYEGKNAEGRDLKLRIYTAGGITQVCNVIYVTDPQTFDAAQDRIDALVTSLEIVTFDPQLLRKYQ